MRPLPLVAAALMVLHALAWWGAGPFDDDFICYRYARNLLEGRGLVFGPGEAEGYTNPLWVLLVAGALALDLDPQVFSRAVGVLAAGVAVWAVGDVWARRHPAARLSPALVVAALPPVAWHAVTGLGTTLLAALLALAFRAWDRSERPSLAAGAWLALACLLRQEAAILALPFAVDAWRRGGRGAALLPVAALAGWTAFRWFAYGQLLPMPWHAKKLPPVTDWVYGARYLGAATLTAGVGLLALLAPLAPRPWRAAGWLVFAHTVYVVHVGGDFMALARFHVPALPLLVLLGAAALRALAPRALLPAGVALALGVQWVQLPWSDAAASHPLVLEQSRRFRFLDHRHFEERWLRVGDRLRATCAPGTSVATSPIGAIGWRSGLPIVDLLGLTNELALGVEPDLSIGVKGHHRVDPEGVLALAPDLALLGNAVTGPGGHVEINPWERGLYTHPEFRARYAPHSLAMPGEAPLVLWVREGAVPPAGAVPLR